MLMGMIAGLCWLGSLGPQHSFCFLGSLAFALASWLLDGALGSGLLVGLGGSWLLHHAQLIDLGLLDVTRGSIFLR